MALTVFPRALYKRLLKSSQIIDQTGCHIALQSMLCGKPSSLYSYELKQNIDIGTSTYSIYDQLVSIMNDGEYSSPTHSYPISFYSIVRNTARLCSKTPAVKQQKNMKFSLLGKYCKDVNITKAEFSEMVTNIEALAKIAVSYKQSQQQIKNVLVQTPTNDTFQCDVIDIKDQETDKEFYTKVLNILQNKPFISEEKNLEEENKVTLFNDKTKSHEKSKKHKKKLLDPVLSYVPKTLQATQDTVTGWRNSILFQHPLNTMSRFNANNEVSLYTKANHGPIIEPYILLGLFAQATHPKLRLTGKKEDSVRIALTMNGEKTLMNVEHSLESQPNDTKGRNSICTFHGYQSVPEMFMKSPLFLGGNDTSTIEILTRNPYCKGVSVLNNKLFWNPDLKTAQKIIASGYGSIDQFRFYKGKIKWNNNLWSNIQDRNLYGYMSTSGNAGSSWATLARLIWSYHAQNVEDNIDNKTTSDSLWYQLLQRCWESDAKEIESWLQLFHLLNECEGNIQDEIYQLMNAHDAKIMQQVKQWNLKRVSMS